MQKTPGGHHMRRQVHVEWTGWWKDALVEDRDLVGDCRKGYVSLTCVVPRVIADDMEDDADGL
jgi:hypothetical protein